MINFLFGKMESLLFLGVPILRHTTVLSMPPDTAGKAILVPSFLLVTGKHNFITLSYTLVEQCTLLSTNPLAG